MKLLTIIASCLLFFSLFSQANQGQIATVKRVLESRPILLAIVAPQPQLPDVPGLLRRFPLHQDPVAPFISSPEKSQSQQASEIFSECVWAKARRSQEFPQNRLQQAINLAVIRNRQAIGDIIGHTGVS